MTLLAIPFQAMADVSPFITESDGNGGLTIIGWSGSGVMTIPSSINGLTVTGISDEAFVNHNSITSASVPNSVVTIADGAFQGCAQMTSISLGYDSVAPGSLGISSIGSYAFAGCTALTSVAIPDTVSTIGSSAFQSCSGLKSVLIGNGIRAIPDYCFQSCTNLSSVQLPTGVTGNRVVSALTIGSGSFFSCPNLTSITFPNTVTSIGDNAFRYAGLTSVTLPDSVKSIGLATFSACPNLTTVTISASVTSIDEFAFEDCPKLASAYFLGSAPTMGSSVFDNAASNFTVYYTSGATGFASPLWTDSSGDTYPAVGGATSDPFSGTSLGGGYYYSSWFGIYDTQFYPWDYRTDIGFIYVDPVGSDVYLYVVNGNNGGSMGWLYTNQGVFPNVYSFSHNSWLYFEGGTSFYNYTAAGFETY